MKITDVDESKLARTGDEYRTLVASDADWLVRRVDDLVALRAAGWEPLAKLAQPDFDAFAASLVYGGRGIAGGSYQPLMSALTITEIFAIFARFGWSSAYALRILEAKCEQTPDMGHADCTFSFWSFCASTCGDEVVVFPS